MYHYSGPLCCSSLLLDSVYCIQRTGPSWPYLVLILVDISKMAEQSASIESTSESGEKRNHPSQSSKDAISTLQPVKKQKKTNISQQDGIAQPSST